MFVCLKLQFVGKIVCNQWWLYSLLKLGISHLQKWWKRLNG